MLKSKHMHTVLKVILLSIALFSIVTPVFAEGFGERLGSSLTSNINAIIPAALLAVGLYFMITRDWMKVISFIAVAVVVAIFTNWTWVQGIAKKFYDSFIA